MGPIRNRHTLIWTVLALAFAVRALVPQGWMPGDLAQGSVLMPCPTDPAMARIFAADTPPAAHSDHAMHDAAGDADGFNPHDAPPCAFTAVAANAPQPPFADIPAPPVPETQRAIPVRAPLILARIARERPPGRAPPHPA